MSRATHCANYTVTFVTFPTSNCLNLRTMYFWNVAWWMTHDRDPVLMESTAVRGENAIRVVSSVMWATGLMPYKRLLVTNEVKQDRCVKNCYFKPSGVFIASHPADLYLLWSVHSPHKSGNRQWHKVYRLHSCAVSWWYEGSVSKPQSGVLPSHQRIRF